MDFKKIKTSFTEKMDFDRKVDPIIWISKECGLNH